MFNLRPFSWAALAIGATIALTSPTAAMAAGAAPRIHDLGTLGGPTSEAVAINDRGQVAGSSVATDGSTHAFLWDRVTGMRDLGAGSAVDLTNRGIVLGNDAGSVFLWDSRTGRQELGTLGGVSATATDVNERGQVVGSIDVVDGPYVVSHAFRWDPREGLADLGVGVATVINASGQVAGEARAGGAEEGFFWDPRTGREPIIVDLEGDGTGSFVAITGINDRGRVIGSSVQAFVWDQGAGARSLNTLDALSSDATDINNRGQVVGRVQDPLSDTDHAYRWTAKAGMVDLTTGQDFAFNATATAINEAGVVVGWAMTSGGPAGGEAFLWNDSSGLTYLGTLGGDSSAAVDINEPGWVAGNAANAAGAQHAVAWIPDQARR